MNDYQHLMDDIDLRPLQIAKHLREVHGVEHRAARKGYEREVWHEQHEQEHRPIAAEKFLNLPKEGE